ncbi:MAG: ClpXP protease specificity-enhancing factor [Casimicrobiaceae bacterium]|nr:ClpXP protease specificity-enhancing factor [Casimicrobiaceae bacterium]MCX8098537.1 ClpXP protease specificity-enhancing factor [Casimicrobiaceae bacterium]MDW8311250.1 ClpXP protease specificity-enhancing factor [Burkholderiales bacterium]
MSDQTVKPYLIRALYEWCVESGYTPHLVVRVNAKTRVPMAYVRDGEIVLNIGPLATHRLTMDNDWILFNARFKGESQEIAIPMSAVIGIYAKETGYGMGFAPGPVDAPGAEVGPPDEEASFKSDTRDLRLLQGSGAPASEPDVAKPETSERRRPTLTVVK